MPPILVSLRQRLTLSSHSAVPSLCGWSVRTPLHFFYPTFAQRSNRFAFPLPNHLLLTMKHQYAVFVAVVAAAIGFANAVPINMANGVQIGERDASQAMSDLRARGFDFENFFNGNNQKVEINGSTTKYGHNSHPSTSTSTSSTSTSTSTTSTSTSSSPKSTPTKAADKKKADEDEKKKKDEAKKNVDKMESVDKEAYWRKFIHTLLSDEPIDKKGKALEDIIDDIKKGTKLPDTDEDKKHAKDSESKKKDHKKKKDEDKKKEDEDKKKEDENKDEEEEDTEKRSLRSEARSPVKWSHPLARAIIEDSEIRARAEEIFSIAARDESDDAKKKAAVTAAAVNAIAIALRPDAAKPKRDVSDPIIEPLGHRFDRRAAGEGAPPSARSLNARRAPVYKPVTMFSRDDSDDNDKTNVTWVRPNKWGIKPLFGDDNSTHTSLSDRLKSAKDNFFNAIKGDDKKNGAAAAHAPAVLITVSFAAASAAGVFLLA
ncbi:hypothetical protein IE81DRAFT_367635 [Ceraceosorus guamensis]|uniref:Uncharacterized protein n=1 Tax=Ceraceosorus guamensis TaxID=1522189 RepID=A0A316VUK6_9BASI|nr:hypothetical protein IE81DRAFT_367635 [Ceraceosorus guamensis]PWN41267.1 hypothetical protein IE81DRAFT_367635 [Ceraceosorus guamensis]